MKRLRFIVLLGLMSVVVLVGCRSETRDEPAPLSTATPTPTPVTSRGGESTSEEHDSTIAPPPVIENSEPSESQGIIYSVPFEVQPDGFGFRNYGPGYPEGDFTIAELRDLFGDGVCSRVDEESDRCVPTVEAQQWIADRNADMRAGHCIGFTVTSYRFAQGELRPAEFTASADAPFDIEQKPPIMRTIALHGSLYWVKSVWSSEVSGTPREIVDALIALREPVDLSIFLPGLVGGHSLLAYGVAEVAPQTYHILVYDNNFPGEEAFVEVDYAANTWRYAQGAVNPDETALPYEGDAASETLRFIPLSAYESATCPFCPSDPAAEESDEAITLLTFLGQGEALVKTAIGAIGWVAGEIINEIPEARIIFQRGQLAANDTPDIALPAGMDFTVDFNGLERVSSLSPTLSFVIDQLAPAAENNQLVVAAGGQGIDFQAGGDQSPSLNMTVRQNDISYGITLLGVDFADGQGVSMDAAKSGAGLELRSQEVKVTNATLLITRQTDQGEAIFATTGLDIADGGGVALAISDWDGSGSMEQYADDDGDGTYDEQSTQLPNEPLDELLQQGDVADGAAIISVLSPVMGDQGLESILAGLSIDDLSAEEIGQILRSLPLTDEQLVDYLATLSLPVADMAELLFALRLEPERLENVIEALDLPDETESALRDHLANLALFQAIALDWAFLNTDDLSQLVALLNERELAVEQLTQLLPRLGLSDPELEQVLGGLDLAPDDVAEIAAQLDLNVPPTRTPSPTATLTPAGSPTPTASLIVSGTLTLTPSTTPTIIATPTMAGTPTGTATPDPYPDALPPPTSTLPSYPYPGPRPTATGDPAPYPGDPTATPDYDSSAYCIGDDLRVVIEEPTWGEGVTIEIWGNDERLFTGEIGPDAEPLEVTFPGPGTWTDLYLKASEEPEKVPLRTTISCPQED